MAVTHFEKPTPTIVLQILYPVRLDRRSWFLGSRFTFQKAFGGLGNILLVNHKLVLVLQKMMQVVDIFHDQQSVGIIDVQLISTLCWSPKTILTHCLSTVKSQASNRYVHPWHPQHRGSSIARATLYSPADTADPKLTAGEKCHGPTDPQIEKLLTMEKQGSFIVAGTWSSKIMARGALRC